MSSSRPEMRGESGTEAAQDACRPEEQRKTAEDCRGNRTDRKGAETWERKSITRRRR